MKQSCVVWNWQAVWCEAHGERDTCIHGVTVIYYEISDDWALTTEPAFAAKKIGPLETETLLHEYKSSQKSYFIQWVLC